MYLLFLLTVFLQMHLPYCQNIEQNERDILSEESRNLRCCAQKLSCCNKPPEATNFEVRALFLKCDNHSDQTKDTQSMMKRTTLTRTKKNATYYHECKTDTEVVNNCTKKIRFTIKIKNYGATNCKDQYILIDHVYDSVTQKKQKLLYPYILKIRQYPIMQLYSLGYNTLVNALAKEKVYNKHDQGYTGCNVDPKSENATCGTVKYDDEPIPYSTGFCCSCDKGKDRKVVHTIVDTPPAESNSNGQHRMQEYDNKQCGSPNNYTEEGNVDRGASQGHTSAESEASNQEDQNQSESEGSGETASSGACSEPGGCVHSYRLRSDQDQLAQAMARRVFVQKRGGQDCDDRYTPANVDPETYQASTHCLEFSDIWYSVFSLDRPRIYHLLAIQIFFKMQENEGSNKWKDLTNKRPVYMGTEIPRYTNEPNTIAMNYVSRKISESSFALNGRNLRLMMPDDSHSTGISMYPELKAGPPEYLVVKDNQIQSNGKTCNVAGVGYEAFAKQPNKCASPKGSCLENQPLNLLKHDHDLEAVGKKGSYFLKYFGLLPLNAIVTSATTQNKTLRMYYDDNYISMLDVELNADENVMLRRNFLAILTEVYIESTNGKRTNIIAKVFNNALISGVYIVAMAECPLDMPASFGNIASKPVLIGPQKVHTFHLEVDCPLTNIDFYCTLQVLNTDSQLLSYRRIRIRSGDRCICMWYCRCACLLDDGALKCNHLPTESYLAAGFQGGMPLPIHVVQYTFIDDMIAMMFLVLLFVCIILLSMGLVKALVGLAVISVSEWGFDIIYGLPKRIQKYNEKHIRERSVVYNDNLWPVHPDTGVQVRSLALSAEFCSNLVFFVIYPVAVIWTIIKRFFFSTQFPDVECKENSGCPCKGGKQVQRKNSSMQRKRSRY
ncbi:unnamed protein product [Acanthoscelides obtectus]|uniref:Generative cell specific-1/HAP2 domain-containing protein n=2 Tax=Acanthoscelides obtectus TaxID=200917 RepID=A0A9P0MF97_ACAOB|nr:unnamed protein product [Acanthoscelides obtectus]CAK1672127.1 Hapless 2 [Acanthoscelides obtectus]